MADQIISRLLLGLDTREFRNGIQNLDRDLKGFGASIKNIGAGIGAAFAGAAITNFAREAINLAAEAQNVAVAFRNVGTSADLVALQEATDGEVSKLQLMERAVKAVGQGVGIDNLTKQLEFANKVSDATGMAFDEVADKLQTAFAKGSTKGLEQVGVDVQHLKEQLKAGVPYAEAFNAAMQATVDKIGPGMDSVADQMDRQKATIEDLKLEIGTALLPVYGGFLEFVAGLLKVANNLLSGHLSFWQKIGYALAVATNNVPLKLYYETLAKVKEQLTDTVGPTFKLAAAVTEVAEKVDAEAVPAFRRMQNGISLVIKGMAAMDLSVKIAATSMLPRVADLVEKFYDFEKADAIMNDLATTIGTTLDNAFSAALTNGEDFFKVLLKGLSDLIKKLIATAIAAAAVAVALMALGVVPSGAAFGQVFKVVGGQMGLPGLGGGGSLGDLAPSPTIGGGRSVLRGNDIFMSNTRTGQSLGRIGG